MTPLLYIVPPAAAALGYGIYRWRKSSSGAGMKKPISASPPPTSAEACAAGTRDGSVDGENESGGPMINASKLLNFSSDATVQAEYDKCYGTAYASKYMAPSTSPDVKADPSKGGITPAAAAAKALKSAAKAAWLAGCSNGGASGWKDAANYIEDKPTPSHSKFSDKTSNDAYVFSFTHAYEVAYAIRDKMSGLPGYGEGESTVWDGSGLSDCQSRFESWYTSSAVAGFVRGFASRVGSVSTLGYLVAGVPGAMVGAVVGGCSKIPAVANLADHHVGTRVRTVVPLSIRDRVTGLLPSFSAGVSGFVVAGFPGAAVASMGHMALTHEGTMYDRAKRVLPVAAASVAGLFVAGVPAAIVAGLVVAGMTHKSSSVDIAKVTGDIRTGSLSHDRAKVLADALEAKGNRTGASAIRAELASKATSKPAVQRSTSRIPAVMRRAMGRA